MFYKLGITFVPKKRMNDHKLNEKYSLTEKLIICNDAEKVWNMEKQLLKEIKENKYIPFEKLKAGGHTECFKSDDIEKIIKYVNENLNNEENKI